MKLLLVSCLLVAIAGSLVEAGEGDAYDKRCRYFGFIRACKIGCKAMGHTTGACDENDKCFCSEQDIDFSAEFKDLVNRLDFSEAFNKITTKFQEKYEEWKEKLDLGDLKKLVPSKCKVSQGFCNTACQSIGRRNGRCNEDFTDCTCDPDMVEPREYGLCFTDTICNMDCTRQGFARGDCEGTDGWTCNCKTGNGVTVRNTTPKSTEGTTSSTQPSVDPRQDTSGTFDA